MRFAAAQRSAEGESPADYDRQVLSINVTTCASAGATQFDGRVPTGTQKKPDSHFRAHLKSDMGSMRCGLGFIDGLCTGLDVGIDTVEVGRGKCMEVAQPVERDGVLRRGISECARVAGHRALVEVVLRLGTEEEPISTEHGVGGERRALHRLGSAEWLRARAVGCRM